MMKKWQENRNYRRIKDEHGHVLANIITVDGRDVAVTEDVFLAYSQADRRERYVMEEAASGKLLSLEQLAEDDVWLDHVSFPSAEDEVIATEDAQEREAMRHALPRVLLNLEDADRELITALFYDGVSTREYARRIGVTQRAVIKRRDRILRDMKKFF